MKFDKLRLIGAITGAALLAGAKLGEASTIDEEIICKIPEYQEYPLKIRSCEIMPYRLSPIEPEVDPVPPYTS